MQAALTAHGQPSPSSSSHQHHNNNNSGAPKPRLAQHSPASQPPSSLVTPTTTTTTTTSTTNTKASSANLSVPSHRASSVSAPSPSTSAVHDEREVHVADASCGGQESSADFPQRAVTPLSPLTIPTDAPISTPCLSPLSCSSTARVRVPLSSVVSSLTHKWSAEYLREAEGGDVEAMCLVAQMYCEGWGALKEDAQEGKRWLERARQAGGAVASQLEDRYAPHSDDQRRSSDEAERRTAEQSVGRAHSRHGGGADGYYSGYANSTPGHSPTQVAAAKQGPLSFFGSVAQAISPKPSTAQLHTAAVARSMSLDQLQAGEAKVQRENLGLPELQRRTSVANASGTSSGSGEDHAHPPHLAHHLGHMHALTAHGLWKRAGSEVHAN